MRIVCEGFAAAFHLTTMSADFARLGMTILSDVRSLNVAET